MKEKDNLLHFNRKYGIKTFKKAVTAVDILATLGKGKDRIVINEDTLVTHLAKETAEKHGIKIVKKGEYMRRPIIAGNWKMNKSIKEAVEFVQKLKDRISEFPEDREIVICPVFTALAILGELVKDSAIKLGAQDVFWEEKGAYTGEISAWMLKDVGCRYVIIGHSERRQYFFDTDETVNRKAMSVLGKHMIPIVCVGEKLEERESGQTLAVIEKQVSGSLAGVKKEDAMRMVLAYEPVWAIGTGKTATPAQAEEVHAFIRKKLADMFDKGVADAIPILYGGSIKPQNIKSLMQCENIDGGLIGGASLDVDSFSQLINY